MPEILFDLIQRYSALSVNELHYMTQPFLAMSKQKIELHLQKLVNQGTLAVSKEAPQQGYAPEFYFHNPELSGRLNSPVVADNLFPDRLPDARFYRNLGLYFKNGRPLDVFAARDLEELVAKDIQMTNNLNELIGNAAKIGVTELPAAIQRSIRSNVYNSELSKKHDTHVHHYSMEDYYIKTEEYAWRDILESDNVEVQLADIRVRSYVTGMFFHLLFVRPELLAPGKLFNREFVHSVHPRLTCIHAIATLTSDPHEQHELFLTAMSRVADEIPANQPDDYCL